MSWAQVMIAIFRRHFVSISLDSVVECLLASWLSLSNHTRDQLWQDYFRCAVTYMSVRFAFFFSFARVSDVECVSNLLHFNQFLFCLFLCRIGHHQRDPSQVPILQRAVATPLLVYTMHSNANAGSAMVANTVFGSSSSSSSSLSSSTSPSASASVVASNPLAGMSLTSPLFNASAAADVQTSASTVDVGNTKPPSADDATSSNRISNKSNKNDIDEFSSWLAGATRHDFASWQNLDMFDRAFVYV
jgi:hypothetical protein